MISSAIAHPQTARAQKAARHPFRVAQRGVDRPVFRDHSLAMRMSSANRPAHRVISLGVAVCLAASAFFFWVWYFRYLRLEFNELGRYFDAENEIVYTDPGFVWCLPAFALLFLAAAKIAYRVRRRRHRR